MAYQPKSYKKFVATAATATLVASAIVPVASAATFTDVNKNYTEAVNYLVANNIAQGTTETTFGTTASITRGDAAVMIANALKLDTSKAPASTFTDLNNRVKDSVNALYAAGIINGKSTTQFAPAEFITRAEMAKVIALAYKLDAAGTHNEFVDVNSTFDQYVDALVKNEITLGKTESLFGATQNVTRGEFALFVYRSETLTPATPEVVSVSAINATQVQVKFGVEVAGGTNTEANLNTNYKIGAVSPASAVLQADKKTVLLTFNNASEVEVTDAVLVVEPIATLKDASVKTVKHTQVFTYEDTVRPVVTSTTYSDYQNAVIHFSEPMSNLGTVTVSNANVVVGALAADGLSVPVSLTAATEGSYTVTMVGATDKSNNLITPNPVTVNLVKSKTDTVAPTVTGVTTSGTSNLSVKFSEALSAVPVITVTGGGATTVTQDLTDPTKYNVALTTPVTGVQTVSVTAGYTDPSGNAGAAYSTLAQFTADTTAPAYVNHSVQTIAGDQYLVVGYNEAVASTTGIVAGSYTDANSVTYSVANLGATSLYDANGDGITESVRVNLTGNTAGNYTVTLPANFAADASTNASASKSVSFALGSVANTTKPVVTSVVTQTAKLDVNKFTVNFGSDVTAGTALNVNNYTVEGQTVFSSAIFDGDQQTVTLTLKDGAITTDGLRNFSVKNVSGVNGVVMDAHTEQVLFDENVKPTVTSATLTAADTIALNFSELMDSATISAAGPSNDFEVYINGAKATVAAVATGADASKYIITLDAATVVNNLSDTVTVNVLNTNDVTDAGTPVNALKTTGSITVAK